MARARQTRFVRPKANTKVWIGDNLGTQTLIGSTDARLGVLSAGALALRPFTILRTRGRILYTSDQTATSEQPFGIYAEGVFSDTASAAGIASLPSPVSDPEQDWFVYEPVIHEFQFISGVGIQNQGSHFEFDSKAMRKVGLDDDVVSIWGSGNSVGSSITVVGRMLIQLH